MGRWDEAGESKLRGGYYTPQSIATWLADWALTNRRSRVLEPSAGDGVFVAAAENRLADGARVDAVELFPDEAAKLEKNSSKAVSVHVGDVFSWYESSKDGTYDAVLGNPPFIRYQTFPEAHRSAGFQLMQEVGLRPNRLTNAWVPFVVLATRALKPGGRLAMVLPAELLQVTYAGELREYLARSYSHLVVVTFRRLVFSGIQQETVLLLGVRSESCEPADIAFVELEGSDDLPKLEVESAEGINVDLDHGREKWIQYYLSAKELALVRSVETNEHLTTLGALAQVDVGIVTGRNEFFVLSPSKAQALGLREWCLPLVGRSAHVQGLALRPEDWHGLVERDAPCLLLQLGKTERDRLPRAALAYVEEGEARDFDKGYKCRIRQPTWWNVPSSHVPDAFLLRQIHDAPRVIFNEAGATCTDTIHRVRAGADVDPRFIAAASLNSVTLAFSEIRGRSYGGGVLELEPTEAEGLMFPRPGTELSLTELDLWARSKEVEQVVDEVDHHVLADSGLTKAELRTLRGVWRKLSTRRRERR
jgi:adenine-specific DNA methylase